MLIELLKAFGLIFVAEMGDKTQILAMAFASKFKIKYVVIGVFIGSLFNHALAVLLGSNLHHIVPIETLSIIAGFSFIVFGLWNLKVESDEDENKISKYGPIATVSLAFFIGELGDKTQLTAIALSTDAVYPVFILIGTVLGMVFTSMVGILIGRKLGNKIDEFYIKMGASIVFLLFGYIKLLDSLPAQYVSLLYIAIFSVVVIIIAILLLIPTMRRRQQQLLTRYQATAQTLFEYYNEIDVDINTICLGEGKCGLCEGNKCPIGYTKNLLKAVINKEEVIKSYRVIEGVDKEFDLIKVRESLKKTVRVLKVDWINGDFEEVHKIRMNLERILFQESIHCKTYEEYCVRRAEIDSAFKD